ncbi:carbohydrate sulfotransferase 15-like [Myxocyprinus asiaticus]|uniref:carbohydrate sulfotransferase 15-like n=1 Tax=Myxocyprinus asiaticus TaxID=70543 RepID=UPI002221A52A|nr:carbohydrate sulfotransferase 15-like [Myxocyprinus asiaticus]
MMETVFLSNTDKHYSKRALLLKVDGDCLSVFDVHDDMPCLRSSSCCVRRSKLFGFILVFIITACYMLSGERKSLLIAPEVHNVCLESVCTDAVTQLLQNIRTKVTFKRRTLPDITELRKRETNMFSVIPQKFLANFKNPCWFEEQRGEVTADVYASNLYSRYSRQMHSVFEYLKSVFRERLILHDGKIYRLRCLPYFYIIGQPKCGTTDLYERLKLHPDVRLTALKEPHWWSRKRFGIVRPGEGLHSRFPVEDYLDLFDVAAHQIQKRLQQNSSSNIIIGEASASTMWDNNAWLYLHDISTEAEPPSLIQDFIHTLQPEARFIAILRDPVERLYSDYLYFGTSNKSSDDFHEKVFESLQMFDVCLQHASLRACVYNSTLNNAMSVRLQVGLYVMYVLDWLSVFSREQLLVLRLEDHASNPSCSMNRIFRFLQIGAVLKQRWREITKRPASNTRRMSDRNLGPMRPVTRELLEQFYAPFNQKLSEVLQDESFLWDSRSEHT